LNFRSAQLSPAFAEIKRLRSAGNYPAAFARLQASAPASDADALEVVVCLYLGGNPQVALRACQAHPWRAAWARETGEALGAVIQGADAGAALVHARAAISDPGASADTVALFLLLLRDTGLVDEAATYVRTHLLPPPAGENFLLAVMAEVVLATGDLQQAYTLAATVLAANPNDFRALLAASAATFDAGNTHEALGNALRANRVDPAAPAAALQIMRCCNALGDYYAAIAAFDSFKGAALPAAAHRELGAACAALGDVPRATEAYERALATGGPQIDTLRALLRLHVDSGAHAAAEAVGRRYPAEIAGDIECRFGLGLAALRRRDLTEARKELAQAFTLGREQQVALDVLPWPVPEPLIRHAYEQLALLAQRGKLTADGQNALRTLQPYYEGSGNSSDGFAPGGTQAQLLRAALTTACYLPDPPFAGRALGGHDFDALEEAFFAAEPRTLVIDNFLSPAALADLRAYCEEATVWTAYNEGGYVGAFLGQGFSPRVLLAVADELRANLPRVFGDHPLMQAWAFKYDQRQRGTHMHADFAKVNVNFWITPDSACEDATTGGLVVYDVPAPDSWTFADYNTDEARMAAFLKMRGAKAVRIPYRENRCVLFDSRLFHVTDEFRFKPGYTNRRINVTLLYGKGGGAL
jgi:tetratricopeptide (TPR) repeat protein